MFYKVFSSATCFPLPVLLNGTFTSSGTSVTASLGAQVFKVGDYLYSTSLNEIRKITGFGNGNILIIESAFSTDIITAEQINITDRSKVYTTVSVSNFDVVDGLLDGYTFPAKTTQNIEDSDGIFFTIDATTTQISIIAL